MIRYIPILPPPLFYDHSPLRITKCSQGQMLTELVKHIIYYNYTYVYIVGT